jgi:uncharacterized protein DUF6984
MDDRAPVAPNPGLPEGAPGGELRPLRHCERDLLARLLSAPSPGREMLLTQAEDLEARDIDDDGSLELVVSKRDPATVVRRIPVEAESEDVDGVTVHWRRSRESDQTCSSKLTTPRLCR